MNKVAIAFLTKDRVELSKRTILPLLQPDKFDLFIIDGSATSVGRSFAETSGADGAATVHANVKGGADAAVCYALTEMLKHNYTHVGLVENDVLLQQGFFDPLMALFDRGRADGLEVGAVSARCYADRILVQREGYALMHNLGWGMQIMTADAASLTLKNMRTHWTTENRRTFARLSSLDIGSWWAFKTGEHWLVPDWGNDAVLASHGLASLALTPSLADMIGQVPSLSDQGLKLVTAPVEERRNPVAFAHFRDTTARVLSRDLDLALPVRFRDDTGKEYIFAHQLASLEGAEWGDGDEAWKLHWSPGFGGFAARGEKGETFSCLLSGSASFLVGGGDKGGQVSVEDLKSGYVVRPTLLPVVSQQVSQVIAPAGVSWRRVRLTVLSGSCIFYGIQCQEPQPSAPFFFNHSRLWPVV